jgi:hypothetical protein
MEAVPQYGRWGIFPSLEPLPLTNGFAWMPLSKQICHQAGAKRSLWNRVIMEMSYGLPLITAALGLVLYVQPRFMGRTGAASHQKRSWQRPKTQSNHLRWNLNDLIGGLYIQSANGSLRDLKMAMSFWQATQHTHILLGQPKYVTCFICFHLSPCMLTIFPQGMNTGIHDATNLGWKLAGVLNGLYEETVLDTYDLERRKSAEKLIQLDRDTSALISGTIPSHFNAPPDANSNDYLELVYSSNASFTVGLGITYDSNILNQISSTSTPSGAPSVKIGHRAPDGPVFRPGAPFPKPLRSLLSYAGRFWILIFAGNLEPTSDAAQLNLGCAAKYRDLRGYIDSPDSFTRTHASATEFLTILHGEGCLQPAEALGVQPLGKTVYDQSGETYARYGVDEFAGAIVVVRPDGVVSFTSGLEGIGDLSRYLVSFLRPSKRNAMHNQPQVTEQARGGEISIEGQEESTIRS